MPAIVSRVVEVCVFRFSGNRPEYLLLRRSPDDALYPGMWQFVTGTIRRREKATDAAMREFREETGLSPERFWVVPFTNAFYDHRADALSFIPFFAAQVENGKEVRLSREHDALQWLPFEQARRKLVWPGQRDGMQIVQEFVVNGEEAGRLLRIL